MPYALSYHNQEPSETRTVREIMAKGKSAPAPVVKSGSGRNNGKAFKKRPKVFDAVKRRLVNKEK